MQSQVAPSTLASIPAFSDLPDAVLEAISNVAAAERFEKGASVVRHTDGGRELYIIVSGNVRISLVAPSGRELTFQILGAGNMFGEVAAVDGKERTATAMAESHCVLVRISHIAFDHLVKKHAEFARIILLRLADLNRRLVSRVFEYHTYDVRGRIYLELLRITEPDSTTLVQVTDRDMASRVGTTRENVSRICGELRKLGVINRDQNALLVVDRPMLESKLEGHEFS